MSLTRFASLLLNFAWLLTAAGLIVLLLWFTAPDLIASVDNRMKAHFIEEPKERLDDIIFTYQDSGDHEVAIARFIALLDELQHVQSVDELGTVKSIAYGRLIRALIQSGRLDQATFWSERWLEYTPRDVEGLLANARLLMLSPATNEEGIYQLKLIQAQFPHSLPVANGAAVAYASLGQLGNAFLQFAPHLSDGHALKPQIGATLRTLEFYYDSSKPFDDLDDEHKLYEQFKPFEVLELHVSVSPAQTQVAFQTKGLYSRDYGFEKQIGEDGFLHLRKFDPSQDFSVQVDIKVGAPEALQTLMQPRFRTLLTEQLRTAGHMEAIDVYERYAQSL